MTKTMIKNCLNLSTCSDAIGVVSLPEHSVDSADRELKSGTARTRLGLSLEKKILHLTFYNSCQQVILIYRIAGIGLWPEVSLSCECN